MAADNGFAGRKVIKMEDLWPELRGGLDDIFNERRIDKQRYMKLYTTVYDYCANLGTTGEEPPSVGRRARGANSQNTELVGSELYEKLAQYFVTMVDRVYQATVELNDEELVLRYNNFWERYLFYFKVTDGIFRYLNQHWIKRQLDDRREMVYYVYTLGLVVWRDHFHIKVADRILRGLLALLQAERTGIAIDRSLIHKLVRSYVTLGIDDENMSDRSQHMPSSCYKFYEERFERHFLQSTEEYYTNEAEKLLEDNSFTAYMRQVELRLKEEDERCLQCFPQRTRDPLASRCEQVLIRRKIDLYQRDFGPLLEEGRDEDLARMYQLCGRVEDGLNELKRALENHITRKGQDALCDVAAKSPNDPREFMRAVLAVHQRYNQLVAKSFQNEPGFTQALDKAAENFINKNAITDHYAQQGAQQAHAKVPELVARFCDVLLKKSKDNPDDSEMEEQLQDVIAVFKYIQDKDVFQQFYTKLLSKRLIHNLSSSDSAESSMISKLKSMCGFEYTNKLQRMFSDTELSKDTTDKFKAYCRDRNLDLGLDFNVMVLGIAAWPSFTMIQMQLPLQLTSLVDQFTNFYNGQHTGRKLKWTYQHSRGELTSLRYAKKYVFLCWTTQMAILMLYNDQASYTLAEIVRLLGVEKQQLLPILASLHKFDLLKSEDVPPGEELGPETPDRALFTIEDNFQSKKYRVDLMKIQIRSEVKKESEVDKRTIEEDRRVVIEACIVRIMKTRKKLSYNELIGEVIDQLTRRFSPAIPKVRIAIEALIERDFLKRSDTSMNVFEYMA
ncbi:unnamed protein product, partial [Mesorhabditis spiculigera]